MRPHPHIGLATVTYLFDGEIMHRDSLGTAAPIRPGAVNWMTAGRGIVHSSAPTPNAASTATACTACRCGWRCRRRRRRWRRISPITPSSNSRWCATTAKTVRVVVGQAYGQRSPVKTTSETLFADAHLKAGSTLPLDADHEERAIYVLDGEIDIAGDKFGGDRLLVFKPGDRITIRALTDAHLTIFGGAPMDGPRHIWWNFVSSRKDRIEQAKAEWSAGHFQKVPGDEIEFIPLPEK